MESLTLVIGNKNYSSWSLRPWLLLKHFGIEFDEVRIPLFQADSAQALREASPSGRVPVLRDVDLIVWDSLAICEYLAEKFPHLPLWPAATDARAVARSVSAEMHAGFSALRENMAMNCRKHLPGKGRAPGVQEDIDRITAIWRDCRKRYGAGGDMLFGKFSIADAMFAPVTFRFVTYGVDTDPVSTAYIKAVHALAPMQDWLAAARIEPEIITQSER
jgi:glutathione S-transferase